MTNTNKTRYLGLDYGDKTIGVALGCPDSRVATGFTTLFRDQEVALKESVNQLREIIREYNISHIVLGLPINMDGTKTHRAEKTLAFKEKLHRNFKSKEIILWDERLSTQAVKRAFYSDSQKNTKKQKETYRAHVDEMAAVYILQGFLNKQSEEIMDNEQNMPHDNMEELEHMSEVIIVTDDDGNDFQLHVLASKDVEDCTYLLCAIAEDEDDTSEVIHLKCIPNPDSDDEDEMSLETVDEDHPDLELVMELFKNDYEELGIIVDEGDSPLA